MLYFIYVTRLERCQQEKSCQIYSTKYGMWILILEIRVEIKKQGRGRNSFPGQNIDRSFLWQNSLKGSSRKSLKKPFILAKPQVCISSFYPWCWLIWQYNNNAININAELVILGLWFWNIARSSIRITWYVIFVDCSAVF